MKKIYLIVLLLSSFAGYSQLQLPYSVKLVNPAPVDFYYGPWATLAAAKAGVPLAIRYDGQTVMITGLGEYHWLAADLTDIGLIAKGGGGGGSGTVNSGTQYRIGIYAATGTAISEAAAITASRALVSDANGVPTNSTTTATEIGYVNGVTSAIQTQLNAKVSPITITSVAYVETTGNDGTGVLGRSDKPYLTITGALNALPASGGVIKIGIGDFTAPADDVAGGSVLKNNVTYEGSKMPWIDAIYTIGTFPASPTFSAPTKLENGTVIKGRLAHINRKNIIIRNLGVDVGSAFCTATGGAYASGGNCIGFGDVNSGTGSAATGMNTGIVIENVVLLGRNATSAFHGLVMENCFEPRVTNVYTFFNTHGFVSKNQGGIYDGIFTHGHYTDGIIFKSNVYAGQQKEILNNFQVRSIATLDGGGVIIQAADAAMSDLQVSNGIIFGCTYGLKVDGVAALNRVDIENVKAISNTADGFKTEGANVQKVNFINCTANSNGGRGFNLTTGSVVTLASPRAHSNTGSGIYSSATKGSASDIYTENNTGYGLHVNGGAFFRSSRVHVNNILGAETLESGSLYNSSTSTGQGATFEDFFTRANNASSIGSLEVPTTPWIISFGTFGISSNKAYNSSARSANHSLAVVDVGVTDGLLELFMNADPVNAHASVIFRYLDANNYMICTFVRTAGGSVASVLYKNIAGVFTAIAGTTVNPLWTGTGEHKISMSWSGTTVSMSLDDIARYTNVSMGTTGLEANTKVGFGQYLDAGAGDDGATTYDNFRFITPGIGTKNDEIVYDGIRDGQAFIAPSENSVYDALALKAPIASPIFTGSLSAPVITSTGSLHGGITATTSNITLDNTHYTIVVDATSSAKTITLPTANTAWRRIYVIKKFDNVNNVTIDANGTETIDRVTTQTLTTQYSSITIQSDGTEWWIIGKSN